MTTFKPGDRVIVNNRAWSNEPGEVITVAPRFDYFSAEDYAVQFDSREYTGDDCHRIHESAMRFEVVKPSASPTYYDFPGGVQVRDISAHLTSFGGQALQYVARATRLDGNNKGEAIKDLRKAIDFIGWEIERLENNA